jgi:hypothetical protein
MLVVLGDSHGVALKTGLEQVDAETRQALTARFGSVRAGMLQNGLFFAREFFRVQKDSLQFLGENTAAALNRIAGLDNCLTPDESMTFGFCFGMHPAILLRNPTWRSFTIDPHCENKQFVSDAAFRAICLFAQRHVLAFFRHAKNLGFRFFVVASPPLRKEFFDVHRQSGTPAEIMALATRFREIVAEALSVLEIPVLFPPPEVAEAGALKPSLASIRPGDQHHGTDRYGALVWRHLAAHAESLAGSRDGEMPAVR